MLHFRTGSLPLPRQFTHYVRSSTCGERDLLSHIVDDPDLSRFDRVVGILLNDLNCSVTRSMAFRIWEARKRVTGGSGSQARRYCCGAESARRHTCPGCSRGCAMACPAPVSSTVSRRSDARAGAEASQHPPGDGRCCQRVRFGLYYRSLLASLLLPFYVPRQQRLRLFFIKGSLHWPCRRGGELLISGRQYRLAPDFGGFTPVL
ncbi:replication protein [Escherichia coli]|nr:replication protein [Escherichia coli]CAD5758981.1 replication protein [Escherichia coli]